MASGKRTSAFFYVIKIIFSAETEILLVFPAMNQ
jgi:hypothetical protein